MWVDKIPQWEMHSGSNDDVLFALYLRDALRLAPPVGLPRLDPAIEAAPHMGTLKEQEDTSGQWESWWRSILEPRSTAEGPLQQVPVEIAGLVTVPASGAEYLCAAIELMTPDAEAWITDNRASWEPGDLTPTNIVREIEAERGEPLNAFRLRIEILPLTDDGVWWIGESAIAISPAVWADRTACAQALRPIILNLA